ncbi:MAG TPA: nicotinate-nicotinamide nucleotide adenylyltransferase [Candidatus Pristimantibacillus sp.]|jgi:nicotinate-nucleotide adenylyltransferase|nr:nicotinate-nicotinamide nucleotide adenylyltransferase [Candidatus Pristimantibacillus sp.]
MPTNHKVLIFGGSFSPPTIAHEAIIRACLAMPEFTEVWLLPSGDRLDKEVAMDGHQRLAMLELVKQADFASDPRLVISDFELSLPRPTQTYQTVAALKDTFPEIDFWFVYGADSYLSMPDWPHGAELQRSLRMLVFGSLARTLPANVHYIKIDEYADVSSTQARAALARGDSLDGLVSPAVARYLSSRSNPEFPGLPSAE